MDARHIIWRSGANTVSADSVRTRRITVALDDIDVVEINRPLLLGTAAFAIAIWALALRFYDVLEMAELVTLLGLGGLGVFAGLVVARVKLHSLSIQGIAIILPVWTAREMREAIDEAIAARKTEDRPAGRRVAP